MTKQFKNNNRSLDTDEYTDIRLKLSEEVLKALKSDNSFIDETCFN